MAIGIGVSVAKSPVLNRLYEAKAYSARVVADSGEVANNAKLREMILMLKAQGLYDNTKLLIAPILGGKWRTSGIYKYASKLYSVNLAANDATQTAEVSQPYQAGNIAPNELLSIKNPNGDNRYLSHPAISFADAAPYSIVCMLNWNGHTGSFSGIINCNHPKNDRVISLRNTTNIFGLSDANSNTYTGTLNNSKIIGKNSTIHFIYNSNRNVDIYIDKVLFETIAMANSSISSSFFITGYLANLSLNFGCAAKWYYYRIQSGAMTAGQITAEYNLLRSWIPEIESVQIGTQTWATSNLAAVATPLGNVIPEVQTAGAVEKVTNLSTLNQSGINVTARTNDSFTTTAEGGVYKTDLLTVGKYYKCSLSGSTTSTGIRLLNNLSSTPSIYLSAVSGAFNSGTIYFKASSTNLYVRNTTAGETTGIILSVQELNWSNATEIYDAVYAATAGDAATKHYAAVKEAAMWCHYDNSTANGAVYNKLYNWYAASLFDLDMASAGYGWHVPTSAEFTTLQTYLGGASVAGGKLKKEGTTYWTTPNTGADNSSGFTGLPSGSRLETGVFGGVNTSSVFYCSNQNDATTAYVALLQSSDAAINLVTALKLRGRSIRLIKNT